MDSFLMTYSEQIGSKRKMHNVQAKTFALNAHGDNQAMAFAHHTNGVKHAMAFFHFVLSRTAFFFSPDVVVLHLENGNDHDDARRNLWECHRRFATVVGATVLVHDAAYAPSPLFLLLC